MREKFVGIQRIFPNAAKTMAQYSQYVTQLSGGQGAVREVCDLIMHAQGTWDDALAHYLSTQTIALP